MTRAKNIVQTGVPDYLAQIFALIFYKPRTLHPKSLNWLCPQKIHRDIEGESHREIMSVRGRETVMWLPVSFNKFCSSSVIMLHSV